DINAASQAIVSGDLGLGRRLLSAHQRTGKQEDLRGFEWYYLWRQSEGQQIATLSGHTWIVTCAAFSPDGALLVTGSQDQTLKWWDPAKRQLLTSVQQNGAVWSA